MKATPTTALAWLALSLAALPGCKSELEQGAAPEVRRPYIGPEVEPPNAPAKEELDRRECERRMRDALAEPAVPGAPAIEASRAEFLARTKSEPVYFERAPTYDSEPVSLTVQGYRQMLREGNPYGTVARILEESAEFPKQARDALLRDGYLYAEDPDLAYSLVSLVQPHQLFGHDRIWIERGEAVLHAERRKGRFYYTDGPLEGERVRLLLFDRAGGGDAPPPPLHLDFRALRYEQHFDRMQIRHVSAGHVVANLHYGKWWVPSVLRTTGAHVSLECEALAPHLRAEVASARALAARRQRVVQSLRTAMLAELDEALPFDEPLHEYGFQLDGTLRRKWLTAYLHHRDKFAYNGDPYRVFDPNGRPLAPQVCIDFLTDTLERTSGTWFRSRGDAPGCTVGKLDFDALSMDRMELRRVPGFITFAEGHPDWFDVKDGDPSIELGDRAAFFGYLAEHVDDFAPGDAVLIKGRTPWDANHVHFHSFFVYESDPVTGMPLVVIGNAGRPSLRSWETEVRRTPQRSILHRIRLSTTWLESISTAEPLAAVPPLAAGPE
jgi:hypothetical protein